MRGTILTFKPEAVRPETRELDRPVTLEELKEAIGGGYLEAVPQFTTIIFGGTVLNCVAFCDEDGKRQNLPTNDVATHLWALALKRRGVELRGPDGVPRDWLVGSIAVVFGDREFMAEL